MMKTTKVLMVCLGNICRSPTAHGVLEFLVEKNNLSSQIIVESAGTSGWHIGSPPDSRSQRAALKRGYDLSHQQGRKAIPGDFDEFDYILAMDEENLHNLQVICPDHYAGHLGLFLAFSQKFDYIEVPDPYYGEGDGFELVLDLVEDAAEGLLNAILKQRSPKN